MDLLKAQLDRIQQQLGGLSASQKMLTASLVAIMVMTLLWWGRYAGQAEMVPLLEQGFASEDIAKIKGQLRSAGIAVQVKDDRIMVPADRQDDAIASLAYADVLPDNIVDGFEQMSQRMTPFDAGPRTDALMKRAKEITLRQVIRRMPGVQDAIVLIEPGTGRRIGGANQASASLQIVMDDNGPGDRKLADAAANLVSGAQQGLKPGQVKVVIGRTQYRLDDGSGLSLAASDELSEKTAISETYLEQKVQGMYPYIQGLIAKVTVDVDNKSSQLQSKKFDKDNAISKEKSSDTRNEEIVTPGGGGAAEPGIVPNTGVSVEPKPAMADATKTSEETKTEFENFVGESVENVSTPAGKVTVVGASVRVPRTHFVEAFKKRYPGPTQPDPAALQAYMDAELQQMAREVQGVTFIKDDSAVTVALYDDVMPMMAATAAIPVGGSVATTVSGHAKEIAIGALAVISLFMVSMMVRKGNPSSVVAAALEPRTAPHLSSGHELAGEAGDGDSMLDGMELDEDAVRAQQMLEQVATMVEENPDAAANIMKRWLNRS